MEFQIEARRTWDIRNTRCRGCDWSFWNAGDQQEVVRFDLTSYLITWWPRVGPCVLFFQVCPVRYLSRVQKSFIAGNFSLR